ncbi:interferon gamma related [Brachionichthys hirsutus]|uniref:interferon gamma related n=1 Tax=Brachionichthys hirsutus TaxID=412623 RepID=UPI00360467A6
MIAMATAVVCLCLALSQAGGSHIPVEMNRTIHSLLRYYKSVTKLPDRSRFTGKLLFSREPPSRQTEAKLVYMGGILETYDKLIGQMLKQLPTSGPQTAGASRAPPADANGAGAHGDVRTELRYVLKKIQELKKHRYEEQEKLLNGLQALRHIQTDNVAVQNKALWELPWLYEEASSLSNNTREDRRRRRRRRRQAQRVKTHLSGGNANVKRKGF